jgi:predicted ATPase
MSGVSGSPFLTSISLREDRIQEDTFPFTLPAFQSGLDLQLSTPVTFLLGENGSGKSTLLEAVAWNVGFAVKGGSRDHRYDDQEDGRLLGRALRIAWRQKVSDGFFMRAETFYDFSTYLEAVGSSFAVYGGQPLNEQSHGEAFLSVFTNRFEDGFYLLDEPEAALSPQRQLAFLRVLHDLTKNRQAQFIIATHSPILLAFPGAMILSFDGERIRPIEYHATEHYRITRDFLEAPGRFFRYLFADDVDTDGPRAP